MAASADRSGAPLRGRMLVISGPSGSGKSTICRKLLEDERVVFSVSVTTRSPRPGEVDGRDYRFVTTDEFRAMVEHGEFIESAEVHGNLYGTLRQPMEDAVRSGLVYLLEVDVQGALQLKRMGVAGLYVFIDAPDDETLRARLTGRGTDAPEVVERRLAKAKAEQQEAEKYDHVIINHDIGTTVDAIRRLVVLDEREGAAT